MEHEHLIGINMKYLASILLIWLILPSIGFGQALNVTTTPVTITLENAETGFDLTASGKWTVQFVQDVWKKNVNEVVYKLYPDKSDRSAAVITAMEAVRSEFTSYMAETLQNGNYTAEDTRGNGLSLTSVINSLFNGACFEDGVTCELYMKINKKQYTLKVDIGGETAAATTHRANIVTQFAIIDSASNAGDYYE